MQKPLLILMLRRVCIPQATRAFVGHGQCRCPPPLPPVAAAAAGRRWTALQLLIAVRRRRRRRRPWPVDWERRRGGRGGDGAGGRRARSGLASEVLMVTVLDARPVGQSRGHGRYR